MSTATLGIAGDSGGDSGEGQGGGVAASDQLPAQPGRSRSSLCASSAAVSSRRLVHLPHLRLWTLLRLLLACQRCC